MKLDYISSIIIETSLTPHSTRDSKNDITTATGCQLLKCVALSMPILKCIASIKWDCVIPASSQPHTTTAPLTFIPSGISISWIVKKLCRKAYRCDCHRLPLPSHCRPLRAWSLHYEKITSVRNSRCARLNVEIWKVPQLRKCRTKNV